MPALNIILDEPAWPELTDKDIIHVTTPISVTGLVGGMASGKPSVALRLDLEDGRVVIAETSLALFLTAADALKARYGDPRKEEAPWTDKTKH